MGIMYTHISLSNPLNSEFKGVKIRALADTGAVHLCVPSHVALQLGLQEYEPREVILADGSKRMIPYAGPVEVRFANRCCYVGAMVMGDEVLLGAIPMEDMDLIVQPMTQEVTVNPNSPDMPSSYAKGFSTIDV